MLTLLIIIFPFIAGLFLLFIKNEKYIRQFALISSLLEAAILFFLYCRFVPEGGIQFAMQDFWIPFLKIRISIGIDGISMIMMLLTAVIVPFAIIISGMRNFTSPGTYYGMILFMQSALMGVFSSFNAILFYVFWELALVPVYFIVLRWGGVNRNRITLKFFIYTLSGSLLMLFAFIYMYFHSPGQLSFDTSTLYHLGLNSETQSWLFWCVFLGIAVKIPLFPFHTWQPDTYSVAPAGGTILLAGVLSKMGIYGAVRWLVPILPQGVEIWQNTVMIMIVAGIIYGSVIAFRQNNLKRFFAYSSLAHTGLITAGIFAGNLLSIQGALFQSFAHGIYITGLFFIAEIIDVRLNTVNIDQAGGIKLKAPVLAAFFIIIILAGIGLPMTNGFIGEFLLITGIFKFNQWLASAAGLSIIIGSVYMLYMYQKVMLGENNILTMAFREIGTRDKIALLIISLIIIATGVFPQLILRICECCVNQTINILCSL